MRGQKAKNERRYGRQKNGPQDVHPYSDLWNLYYDILLDKMNFVQVIEDMDCRWRHYSGLSGLYLISWVLKKARSSKGCGHREKYDQDQRDATPPNFEGGGRDLDPRIGGFWNWRRLQLREGFSVEKARKWMLPCESPERNTILPAPWF